MKFVFAILFLTLTACAGRTVKILDAPWVSMKNQSLPASLDKLKSVGSIDERYCQQSWTGSYGLMDEVLKQTQAKYDIDFVRNASFTKDEGTLCVNVIGEGYRTRL
jgi:hypothetical protein